MRALAILSLAAALGCGGGEMNPSSSSNGKGGSAPSAAGTKLRFAVIPKGTTHEFWKSVHYGAEQAAKELGNVEILWKGPLQENDREGQIKVVQDFIVQKVDGICLAPLDSQSLGDYVGQAHDKNIPVVIFDSGLDDETHIVSYVATDNRRGGQLAGKRLAESLGGKGDVILLRYNTGSESTQQREEGFLEAIKEYPEIKVLSSDEYAGTTPEDSLTKALQVLGRYKAEVDGIFAVCEPNATGVLEALSQTELAGKVKFVAFDPNVPLVNGMSKGEVDGIVLQDPVKMGYEAVMTMAKSLKGEQVEKRIVTGEYVATPDNMKEERMSQLLKPAQYGE
jgi:ribose transport system substrate-binding protein